MAVNPIHHDPRPVEEPVRQSWSDSERAAITDELDQILADHAFSSSKRCQALLRRLVEHALAGDHDGMKERTLGAEVFGRVASYDTATDPIVRITANEIRKRLGQWYQDPSRRHTVKIRLVAGSYLPKFDFDSLPSTPETSEVILTAKNLESPDGRPGVTTSTGEAPATLPRGLWRKPMLWVTAGVLAILIAVVLLIRSKSSNIAEFAIWEPLTRQQAPLTLLISGDDWPTEARAQGVEPLDLVARVIASREMPQKDNSPIFAAYFPAVDAFLANKITDRIALHGKQTILRRSSELSFDDLRHEPVVIIGGINPWSLILLSKLRYSERVDPVTRARWIQDSQNPSSRKWTVADTRERADVDYAIVSRYLDAETGHWVLSLGGLWPYGTVSACSLLTDAEYARLLPPAFRAQQNAQLVLKTNVINGNPGPPQVVAVYTW